MTYSSAMASNAPCVATACDSRPTIAVKSDGTVWAWGDNYAGRLATGTGKLMLLLNVTNENIVFC